MFLLVVYEQTINKVFKISPTPISEKVEAFHADEMTKIWISDALRNWDLFVKYPKFDDWSSWNSSSGGNK